VTYLPAIQRAPHSAKRSSAARCWAGDEYQSLAVLNWLDWFMAVGVGKLHPSLDPTRSVPQVLFGSKALRRRVRALRVRVARLDGAHDGGERCHTNRFYWSVLTRRRSRFDEINGLANR
jgi:hypothetical protein